MVSATDHIYVHVPFCDGKCAYCAFYSELLDAGEADRYLEAVERELERLSPGAAPATVYFGGGTPAILDTGRLARLCGTVLERVSTDKLVEWTVEANPGTLPADKIRMLRESGVNRISLGAQSFDDTVLKRIGRRHDAAAIAHTLEAVRSGGIQNVGLDLIACLPGVDDGGWRSTLRSAIEVGPDHISVYALSVEPGSAFARSNVTEPVDDAVLESLKTAEDSLEAAGYKRYEISNYSKPGRECLHNLSCWRGEDYLGFGPAAASRDNLRRWTNRPDTNAFCNALIAGNQPPRDEEELAPGSDATERLIFAFRLSEGVSVDSLAHPETETAHHWGTTLERLRAEGLTERYGGAWRLTARGRALADHVASELIP